MVKKKGTHTRRNYYSKLEWTIFAFMLLVVLLPLPVVAGTIYRYYHTYVRSSVEDNLRGVVEKRREAIEVFLAERVSYLQTLAQIDCLMQNHQQQNLEYLFAIVKPRSPSFVDMGMIDHDGRQFAYVGPYDLAGKDYSEAVWFLEARKKGVYISDVFLGYRNVPHLAIAVQGPGEVNQWFLRATINTDTLKRLISSGPMGAMRDAYLYNRGKEHQLHLGSQSPIIDPATIVFPQADEIRVGQVTTIEDRELLTASGWLNHGRWLLMVAEDPTSEFVSLTNARSVGLSLFFTAVLIVGILAYYTAHWIVRKIEVADREKDLIQEHLARTSKLVSLGKMAAGLAHEINNPLAIISESAGYAKEVMDMTAAKGRELDADQKKEIRTVLDDITGEAFRGRDITQRLLGFARHVEAKIMEVDLNRVAADLLKYYARILAKTGNVRLVEEFDRGLSPIKTDPSQLQQVLINLIDNALHFTAINGGTVKISTQSLPQGARISVQDDGPGMKPSVKEKIFDPFFTTKPVGKGTGLGLAICYGIVKKLGGEIYVESEEGQGATFTIQLPLSPPIEEVQE
ncbi:MAG: sensor histidine kinase [Deltaproteobacteria bacterium]|nr:sensor histidine kinase [Deltaproteobacteria bacterium]